MSDFLEFTYIPGGKIAIENAEYAKFLFELDSRFVGTFTRSELDQAAQAVMSHYARPGLMTMYKLLRGDKALMRDFIRELGKQMPDVLTKGIEHESS